MSKTPANAIVHEWVVGNATSNFTIFYQKLRFAKSGATTYAPSTVNNYYIWSTTTASNYVYGTAFNTTSGTANLLNYVPKIIFWKSANATALFAINRTNGAPLGAMFTVNKFPNGYVQGSGAVVEGTNFNGILSINQYGGGTGIEGFSEQEFGGYQSRLSTGAIYSSNDLPNQLFSYGAVNYLIASTLKVGFMTNTLWKTVSDEVEGIIIAEPSAMAGTQNSIVAVNSKYYIYGGSISDNSRVYRFLFELGT